ncbi:hypothetical protein JI58_03635 [Marinosulfonomonas sp. PRT-SC04]|nr:hypothetical protein JI58_03635 [Marinosulfonomonas sp. PRT-SC04]
MVDRKKPDSTRIERGVRKPRLDEGVALNHAKDKPNVSGALEIPCHFYKLSKRNDTCEKNLILI